MVRPVGQRGLPGGRGPPTNAPRRELDRERTALQNQEKRLVGEIKGMAQKGQNDACKVMAKQMVRNRHAVRKFFQLKSHLQAVSLKITTAKSMNSMAHAMAGATKAMGAMNRQFNVPALRGIMMEFEKQNAKMDMTEDMMADAMDDVFDGSEEEEETEEVVNQVLDEIGINLQMQLVDAPGAAPAPAQGQRQAVALGAGAGGGPGAGAGGGAGDGAGAGGGDAPSAPPAGGGGGGLDDDLQARLDALRKG